MIATDEGERFWFVSTDPTLPPDTQNFRATGLEQHEALAYINGCRAVNESRTDADLWITWHYGEEA